MDFQQRVEKRRKWCEANGHKALKGMTFADESLSGYIKYLEDLLYKSGGFTYFVSYHFYNKATSGFGNYTLTLDEEIEGNEQITKVQKIIQEKYSDKPMLDTVIMIDFKLLNKG